MNDETTETWIDSNWEPDETVVLKPDMPTIDTKNIDTHTVSECPKCKAHNRFRNGKCAKCDYWLV
jgi:hypothetical protein